MPPAKLKHYRLVRPLGSGGMGTVYEAQDTHLDRTIALKLLPESFAAEEGRRARFQREARMLAALSHPNIVTVYSVEEADGIHFITMELVAGFPSLVISAKTDFPSPVSWSSRLPSPRPSPLPTRKGSSTATSSRRT